MRIKKSERARMLKTSSQGAKVVERICQYRHPHVIPNHGKSSA